MPMPETAASVATATMVAGMATAGTVAMVDMAWEEWDTAEMALPTSEMALATADMAGLRRWRILAVLGRSRLRLWLGRRAGGYGGGYGGYGLNGSSVNTGVNNSQPIATPANPPTSNGTDYVTLGESDFRAGEIRAGDRRVRHALIDEPNNAGLMMLVAQSLFQTEEWTPAAAAPNWPWAHCPR